MTDLQDPKSAKVLVVGLNEAKTFAFAAVGDPDRYVDALFNRNGRSCRGLYDQVTAGRSSPARKNTDRFRRSLAARGVTAVLETNIVNFSSPLGHDLATPANEEGLKRGEVIFRYLLAELRPQIIVAHGEDTCRRLGKELRAAVALPPDSDGALSSCRVEAPIFSGTVFPIPSLAPPAWNAWSGWAWGYLDRVAEAVATELAPG